MSRELTMPRAAQSEDEERFDTGDLVLRTIEGERSALGELYDLHGEPLRRFARRLIGDHAAAEDLVHDVFLALPRALERYDGRSALRSFLFAIACNKSKHHVRAAARYRRAKERYAGSRDGAATLTPEVGMQRTQAVEQLARALDTLPLEQRIAFVLRLVEERTGPEVARITGVPEATVRTRVLRARKKIRLFIEAEEDVHE